MCTIPPKPLRSLTVGLLAFLLALLAWLRRARRRSLSIVVPSPGVAQNLEEELSALRERIVEDTERMEAEKAQSDARLSTLRETIQTLATERAGHAVHNP